MKAKLESGGIVLPYILGGTMLLGSILSAVLTSDDRWLGWHFSRLGEGGALSATIFNLTLMIGGVIMFLSALSIRQWLLRITSKSEYKRAGLFYFMMMGIISICLLTLAIFPFDKNPVIHNIAGYSMLFSTMILAVFSSKVLAVFSNTYKRNVKLMMLIIFALYLAFFISHSLSLLFVEFTIFIMIFIWFIGFSNTIYKLEPK